MSDRSRRTVSVSELALISKAWRKLCAQRGTLTQDTFLEAFARIEFRSQLMLDALFNAADANSNVRSLSLTTARSECVTPL